MSFDFCLQTSAAYVRIINSRVTCNTLRALFLLALQSTVWSQHLVGCDFVVLELLHVVGFSVKRVLTCVFSRIMQMCYRAH